MRACLVVTSILMALQLSHAAATELVWETMPLAGVAELKNGKPADGIIYAAQMLLEEQMPEFSHQYEVSAPKRLVLNMARGKRSCSTSTLRHPDRDAVGYFIPFLPTQPMQLVVRRELLEKLPLLDGQVVLTDLIKTEGLKGIIVGSRGYPSELTELLSKGTQNQSLDVISSTSSGANVIGMIQRRRADYTLEFPIVFNSLLALNEAEGRLLGLPIRENQALSESGVYCSRTVWGKSMAKRIDQAVRHAIVDTDKIMKLYGRFQQGSDFEDQIKAYLTKRAQQETLF